MGIQLREFATWARNRKILATLLITMTLAVGMLIGTVISGHVGAAHPTASAASDATPLEIPDPVQLSNAFASIVSKVQPAVVNISTTQVVDRGKQGSGAPSQRNRDQMGPDDDQQQPFQDFFNRFFDFPQQGPTAERSLGSGVIVDKRGYILTNNHVVDQATKVQVSFDGDTTMYTAKVVGTDEETDLAVIKIDVGRDLPTAKLGNSDGVQVGDWVLAIGNPFGFLQGS